MNKVGTYATVIGLLLNFALFLVKIYVGISSNSLAIYCDAINNLGDTFACIIAFFGFLKAYKLDNVKSARVQSLCTFVIGIIIAFTAVYFIYNGVERLLYPLQVSYTHKYAILIGATVVVKIIMGVMYTAFNKKANSTVLKALVTDSYLDCAITLFALMGLFLISKINYAVDGIFAIVLGSIIAVSAIKNIITQTKFLING